MRKFSMLFAAAAMVFAMQTVWAADDIDDDADETQIEQSDDGTFVGRWRSKRGPGGHMMRFGGHGPQMMHGMHRGGMGGMGGGMMMHPRAMLKLDLTDAQITQVVDLMSQNYRDRMLATIERVRAYEKLADLHESDSADHDAILAANQAVGTAQGKLDVLAKKLQAGIKDILTPDQLQKMEDMKKDMRKDMKKRFDGRRDDRRDDGERRGPRGGPRTLRGPGPRMMDK